VEDVMTLQCENPGKPSRIVLSLLAKAGVDVLSPLYVLDATYGRGEWWREAPQAVVYAVDPYRWEWVRKPRCYRKAPIQTWRQWAHEVVECLGANPQVVAVDPPWGPYGGLLKALRPMWSKAVGPPEDILRAGLEVARHFGALALVRWREPLAGNVVAETCTKSPLKRKGGATAWWGVVKP